jgi:hypothetical protein
MTRGTRLVSQDVSVAEFHANLGGNARQFVQIGNREGSPTCDFSEFGKKRRSVMLFERKLHVVLIENSHSVELAVRFLQILSDPTLTVPAVIITAIGNDD